MMAKLVLDAPAYCLQTPMEFGLKRGRQSTEPMHPSIIDKWRRERVPPGGFKGSAHLLDFLQSATLPSGSVFFFEKARQSEANLQVYVETPLHPEKLTVWCALWAGGIIGPYFFKNDEGHNVTVNVDRYRAMMTNFFIPELNNHHVQELWFQQDGATCHTARAIIDLLKDTLNFTFWTCELASKIL
ncbi:DUF4817 domain-containing protein [Trichonephila clavipes]|nr:DUF4817 domain-containing protein [Trichonephila clavipes]